MRRDTLRRLAWFAGLWLASVAALAIVAYAIHLMIVPGGAGPRAID